MGSPVLHIGAGVICAHGGSASPTTSFDRVRVGGQPVLTVTSSFLIADCAGDPSAPTNRCVVGRFLTGAARVLAGGAPVLVQHSASACEPTGTPMIVTVVQSRVIVAA
jgi:hypothetical protein